MNRQTSDLLDVELSARGFRVAGLLLAPAQWSRVAGQTGDSAGIVLRTVVCQVLENAACECNLKLSIRGLPATLTCPVAEAGST